jgi:hypothetical protein
VTPPDACDTGAIELQNGCFRNVLLAQTITLDLNTRYDPNLPFLELCHYMKAQNALCGDNGICGDDDDELDPGEDGILGTGDDPIESRIIPWSVLNTLDDDAVLHRDVGGLLALANRALGADDPGEATLDDINQAVSAINELFDECAFIIYCSDTRVLLQQRQAIALNSEPEVDGTRALPTQFRLGQNVPNPFGKGTMIHFDLPERSQVRLAVYDITGRMVELLAEQAMDAGFHSVTWDLSDREGLSAGVYFYTIATIGLESNKHFSERRKMILTR